MNFPELRNAHPYFFCLLNDVIGLLLCIGQYIMKTHYGKYDDIH